MSSFDMLMGTLQQTLRQTHYIASRYDWGPIFAYLRRKVTLTPTYIVERYIKRKRNIKRLQAGVRNVPGGPTGPAPASPDTSQQFSGGRFAMRNRTGNSTFLLSRRGLLQTAAGL